MPIPCHFGHIFTWAGTGDPSPEARCDCGMITWAESRQRDVMPKAKTYTKVADATERHLRWPKAKPSPTEPTAVRVNRLEPPTDASHAVGVTKLNPLPTTASKTEIREKAEGYRIAHHQFLQETRELLSRLEAGVRGMMVGTWKSWIAKTKPHGGTREEWERLNNHGYDEAIKDVLALIEKEKG